MRPALRPTYNQRLSPHAVTAIAAAGNMHAYFSFAERHNNGLRDTFIAEYNALGGYVRRRAGSFNAYPIHRRRPVARRVERIAQRLPAAVFKDCEPVTATDRLPGNLPCANVRFIGCGLE